MSAMAMPRLENRKLPLASNFRNSALARAQSSIVTWCNVLTSVRRPYDSRDYVGPGIERFGPAPARPREGRTRVAVAPRKAPALVVGS